MTGERKGCRGRRSRRGRGAAWAALPALALGSWVLQEPEPPPPEPEPAAEAEGEPELRALPAFEPGYRGLTEVAGQLREWIDLRPEAARPLEVGSTADGRPVPAIEVFRPGEPGPEERPAVLLLGGLDGISLAGGEAVLATIHALLEDPATLPAEVTFLAVPWASPEALELHLRGGARDGRNARGTDEDGDGRVDEDGPDDVDGDDLLLQMLIESPTGPWIRAEDGRFLVPAADGDSPRFLLTLEGRDEDGDGRFNEDPPGGVDLDRNFALGRPGPWEDPLGGPVPMSEPLSRALADLALSRRAALALLYQGSHGALAVPGGVAPGGEGSLPLEADGPVFQRVTAAFVETAGRSQERVLTLAEARHAERTGAALDWLYAVPGILAVEVAPWGPQVERSGGVTAKDARFPADAQRGPGRTLSALDEAWRRWLDNTRGGLGFSDWRPVDLGDGVQGLIGGWEPRTRLNPPPDLLPRSLTGLSDFALRTARMMPRLEIILFDSSRDGELVRLRVRLRNPGELPTGLSTTGRWRAAIEGPVGASLELVPPAGARVVAGETRTAFGRILGGAATPDCEWLIVVPEGSPVILRASAPWCLPAELEVRP